jgi:collagenase-like PrtC family protease
VGAAWELSAGATSAAEALKQLQDHHAFALVVQEPVPGLVARARERFPVLRIVSLGSVASEASDATVNALEAIRAAILGLAGDGRPALP